jgi:phenylacetate-coenzyme A ligase PaaK-like adenylate-forming protein
MRLIDHDSIVLPPFDPWRTGAASLDVITASRGDPLGIERRRRARLAALLDFAIARSPLYRRLAGHPQTALPPLDAMPVVTKRELMQHFPEWVTDPQLRLDDLRRHLADPHRVGEPVLRDLVVWESSGSSGEPGVFVQDPTSLAVYDALEALRRPKLRPMERWLDPWYVRERLAFIGATGGHYATTVSVERLRRLNPWMGASLRSFSFLMPTDELVARLNDHAPTIIATYPTAAVLLAEQALRGRLRIAPKEFWTGGEALTPAMRATVRQAFGCPIANGYGASEFLAMASECTLNRLHLNTDWVILEPVDASYRRVPDGTTGSTTLLTNLANRIQPLIRYDLGDRVTLHAGRCACGSPLPVIEVEGRTDDALVLSDERGDEVRLRPLAQTTVLEDDAGVHDFQIEQRAADALLLRVGADGEALPRASTALHAYLRRMGLPRVHVDVRREAGVRTRSGKLPRVVCSRDAAETAA